MGKLRTILGSFAALSLLATLGGCPKPEEKFTEFEARWCTSADNVAEAFTYCSCSTDADCGGVSSGWICEGGSCTTGCRGSDGNGCPTGIDCSSTDATPGKCAIGCDVGPAMAGEADGLYFFSLVPTLSPNKPAPLLVTLTSSAEGPTGLQFSLEVQPVDAVDRMSLVGSPFTVGPFAVNGDGSFEADWGSVEVPGETNPVTDSILGADLVLVGALCTMVDDVCGIANGQITSPLMLDLAGTTFYMEKVDTVADHTEPPYLNCAKDQGAPL